MFKINSTEPFAPNKVVRVGIIGCGMVTQVVHIPTLGFLSHLFDVVYLCDASDDALQHCQSKVAGRSPKITRSAEVLCTSAEVDLVLVADSDTFHMPHTQLALKNRKHVFVEKPIALTLADCDEIAEADKAAEGNKVFVGYMRRYCGAFSDALREIGSIEKVRYARIRDIIGPNSVFVSQSGTFPKTFSDYEPRISAQLKKQTEENIRQALEVELQIPMSEQMSRMWELLSGLGSHDLSAMREFALLQFGGFAVSYESGIDQVPRFDASIEIFGDTKRIKVTIDTPFVKGLPTTIQIQDTLPDGSYRETTIRRTYEDPYTLQMKEVHAFVVDNKPPKTSATDAKQDVQLNGMILKAASLNML